MPQYNHLWHYLPHGNDGITLELRQLLASVTPAGDPFNLWDFDYPSYYEGSEKTAFEQKVIDHFYFREIGFETPGRFVHHFRQKMREIMPYYIQLYKSVELMDDPDIHPLENYRLNEEHHNAQHSTGSSNAGEESVGTSTTSTTGSATTASNASGTTSTTATTTTSAETDGNTSSTTATTSKRSDTPQGSISNLDHYLTEASVDNGSTSGTTHEERGEQTDSTTGGSTHDETSTEGSTSSNGSSREEAETTTTTSSEAQATDDGTLVRYGNIGVTTYADLLEGYRKTFRNIDMEIINELEELFLRVY